jgi:hypothetical protein
LREAGAKLAFVFFVGSIRESPASTCILTTSQ